MDYITEKEKCTGCSACKTICPQKAIKLAPDSLGFLYPEIEKEKCVDCGLCVKICPVNGKTAENEITETLGAINKNEEIRLKSSSGGIFDLFAREIISENGVVFGVILDENQNAIFTKVYSVEQLEPLYGSKYVQASANNIYAECKNELEAGKKVLFSGTPCQIGGLRSYLKKDYENLVCIDFICHGVPSPALWQKYVKYQEDNFSSQVVKTSFRHKNCGWKKFSLKLVFANSSEYLVTLDKDKYLQLFLKDNCLRESCYNCYAKGIKRFSDITIADFWGIQNILPQLDDDKGTSVVCLNSEKGKVLFTIISEKIKSVPFDKTILIKRQKSLTQSCKRTETRALFENEFIQSDIDTLYRKFGRDPLKKRIRKKLSRIKNSLLKKVGRK